MLGYVQYLIDFNYCFQFTACYFVIYIITLLHNVSWQGWHMQQKRFLSITFMCVVTFISLMVFIDSFCVLFSYVDNKGEIWTVSFSSTKDQLKKLHHTKSWLFYVFDNKDGLDLDSDEESTTAYETPNFLA